MILNLVNHKIEILKQSPVRLPEGDYQTKTVTFKIVWCDVTRATLKEYREGNEVEKAQGQIIFLVNYMDARDITRDMFVKFEGQKYNIKNIEPDYERHDYTRITGRVVTK